VKVEKEKNDGKVKKLKANFQSSRWVTKKNSLATKINLQRKKVPRRRKRITKGR